MTADKPQESSSGTAHAGGEAFITQQWSRTIAQPVLIMLTVAALFTGILSLLKLFGSQYPWMALIPLLSMAAVESIYTTLWLSTTHTRADRLSFRAAEILMLALFVRLFTWAVTGSWPQLHLLRSYLISPFALFDDSYFIISVFLTLLAWGRALSLSSIFSELAIDQAEAAYYTTPRGKRPPGNQPIRIDRGSLVNAFLQQWAWGAALLLVAAAITTVDLGGHNESSQLWAAARFELTPELAAALIIYFVSGFLLLSQGRLAAMNARWLMAGVSKNRSVERSWHRAGSWLVILAAVAASFLPLGSTISIGRILETFLRALITFLSLLVTFFLGMLAMLFRNWTVLPPETVESPLLPTTVPTSPPPAPAGEMGRLFFSSLIWAVGLLLIVSAVILLLRERQSPFRLRSWRKLWDAITRWLASWWHRTAHQISMVRQAILSPAEKSSDSGKQPQMLPWRFIRVGSMSPRDQIRYYYLATVKRAGKLGVERSTSATPFEYGQRLRAGWPESQDEIERLTNLFLEARYSGRQFRPEEAAAAKGVWKRVRTATSRRNRRAAPSTSASSQGTSSGKQHS